MHSMTRGAFAKVPVVMALIITMALIDTLAFRISIFYREQYVLTIIFIIVSVVISIGQLVILFFITDKSKVQAIGHSFGLIQRLVPVAQYALVAIVVVVILQLVLSIYYSTVLLISA